MRFMTIISVGASAVLGISAVFLVRGMINKAAPRSPVLVEKAAVETVPVVIADKEISFGDSLKPQHLKLAQWPKNSAPEGSFSTLDLFEEQDGTWRSALVRMAKNEPVLSFKVSGEGQRQSLSSQIGVDMRAFSIRIDQTSGVGGFILPGDNVDVVLVRALGGEASKEKKKVSDLIVQNVRVLGVDQNADATSEKTKIAKTATVEVNAQDAQRLALAAGLGDLTLILRRAGSVDMPLVRQMTVADLKATPPPVKRARVRQLPKPRSRTLKIAVIRPDAREVVRVPAIEDQQKADTKGQHVFASVEENLEGGIQP